MRSRRDSSEPQADVVATVRAFLRASGQARLMLRDADLRSLDATAAELLLLLYVDGPQSATDVDRRLGVERSKATHALRRLADAGYVSHPAERSKRHVRFRLTPSGEDTAAAVARELRAAPGAGDLQRP